MTMEQYELVARRTDDGDNSSSSSSSDSGDDTTEEARSALPPPGPLPTIMSSTDGELHVDPELHRRTLRKLDCLLLPFLALLFLFNSLDKSNVSDPPSVFLYPLRMDAHAADS